MTSTTTTSAPIRTSHVTFSRDDLHVGTREAIPRWSTSSRLALGAWTMAMPLMAACLGIAAMAAGNERPSWLFAVMVGFFVAHAIIAMLYIAFAAQNPRLGTWRTAWLFSLAVAGPVAIPAYWLMHVYGAPKIGRPGVDEDTSRGLERGDRARARVFVPRPSAI